MTKFKMHIKIVNPKNSNNYLFYFPKNSNNYLFYFILSFILLNYGIVPIFIFLNDFFDLFNLMMT